MTCEEDEALEVSGWKRVDMKTPPCRRRLKGGFTFLGDPSLFFFSLDFVDLE